MFGVGSNAMSEQPVVAIAFKHNLPQFQFSLAFVIAKFSCKTSDDLGVVQIVFILYLSLQVSVSSVWPAV